MAAVARKRAEEIRVNFILMERKGLIVRVELDCK